MFHVAAGQAREIVYRPSLFDMPADSIARGLPTDVSVVLAAVVAVLLAAALHVAVERPAMDWIRAQYRRRLEHQAARADSRAPTELR